MPLITPELIRKKAMRLWTHQAFLKSEVTGDPFFPLEISAGSVSAKEMLAHFSMVQNSVKILQKKSRAFLGAGYDIGYREVHHRRLGTQKLPAKIHISTREDFLFLIKKEKEAVLFKTGLAQLMEALPETLPLVEQKPLLALTHRGVLSSLIAVCQFFKEHPKPDKYIRELDIPGVDTKFIEAHRPILKQMLDLLLPAHAINENFVNVANYGFEKRFYLKYDMSLIRFRLLDSHLISSPGLQDISTPLAELACLDLPVKKIFITENKINGLSFPPVPGSMVIFGLGYGIQSLKDVAWLGSKEIFYWGDIDTHGFAILSMVRHYFPDTRSFLMDRGTLFDFKALWVKEDKDKRSVATLSHLTREEQALYRELVEDIHGHRVRLEQERISHAHVKRCLAMC